MNIIITNGAEIKKRIISEIEGASKCIYLAMAWFTDRDIATAIIDAKNRNVEVDIVLSSNAANETVKLMLKGANVSVHAFETGDERGMMHHKFCLIDHKISINGSYNYSYNASNNNVENVQVSDNTDTYKQFLLEFERIKYNIDNNIAVNAIHQLPDKNMEEEQPINIVDAFSQQLQSLVYLSTQIDTEEYKKMGYEKSRESGGSIEIFKAEYNDIKEKIKVYATDDGLSSKKSVLTSNISHAFESRKAELEEKRQGEIVAAKRNSELEKRQLTVEIADIAQEKSALESGNLGTGEKGILQINKEIEKNKLERKALEQSFVVKKFWSVGTIFALLGLCVFVYYLSLFFASAMYKVFFEGNAVRASLEAGDNPGLPQLVDANAIIKIFTQQGTLFGLMALLFFLIPILLSNLKLLGSGNRWVNNLSFWVGVLIFDIVVSIIVTMNIDEIKSLLIGEVSQMQMWEVVKHGEFWMIFVFGMLPLIITHFLIGYLTGAYKNSQRELVDAEKSKKIQVLDDEVLDLMTDKEALGIRIKEKEDALKESSNRIQQLEKELNNLQNQIEHRYAELLNRIKAIYNDFHAKITSGKIFTDVIFDSVVSAYVSGYIEYLPRFYAETEVANRVREIEYAISNKSTVPLLQ